MITTKLKTEYKNTLSTINEIAEKYNVTSNRVRNIVRNGKFGKGLKIKGVLYFSNSVVKNHFASITGESIRYNGKTYKQYSKKPHLYFSQYGECISTLGGVIKELTGTPDKDGYLKIANVRVHRGVYETYFNSIREGYEIDHIDSNKFNNNYLNLREVTPAENKKLQHLNQKANYKLNSEDVKTIRYMYESGESVADIYSLFNHKINNIYTITNVVKNRTWTSI